MPNTAPTANAGPDQIADEHTIVRLTGTGSDPEGPVAYAWSQVSGPSITLSSVTASSAGAANPIFLAPVVPIRGKQAIELRLTVTDSAGATASDTMTVTVASNDYVVFATGTPAPPLGLYSYDAETGDVATLFAPLTDRGFLDEAIAPDRSRGLPEQ